MRVKAQVPPPPCVPVRMPARRLLPLLTVLLVLVAAGPASAAQRIVRFDPDRTSASQLRTQLTALGLGSTALSELPFALAVGDSAALARVDALPGVVSTHANERLEYHLHESAPLLFGGEQRRAAAYAAGYDGRGQNVAVIDTGTDGLHPDLRDRVVRNVKIVGVPDNLAPGDQFHQVVECPTACTTDTSGGHRHHVSRTAVRDGT